MAVLATRREAAANRASIAVEFVRAMATQASDSAWPSAMERECGELDGLIRMARSARLFAFVESEGCSTRRSGGAR